MLIDQKRRLAHAVLMVKLDGRALVLHNLEDRVRSWSELPHYRPLYALNEQAVWLHVTVGKRRSSPKRGPVARAFSA